MRRDRGEFGTDILQPLPGLAQSLTLTSTGQLDVLRRVLQTVQQLPRPGLQRTTDPLNDAHRRSVLLWPPGTASAPSPSNALCHSFPSCPPGSSNVRVALRRLGMTASAAGTCCQ